MGPLVATVFAAVGMVPGATAVWAGLPDLMRAQMGVPMRGLLLPEPRALGAAGALPGLPAAVVVVGAAWRAGGVGFFLAGRGLWGTDFPASVRSVVGSLVRWCWVVERGFARLGLVMPG